MHQPDKGTIVFEGEDITGLRSFERIRRGISVKFQVPGIFKALPVRQNLEIAFQHHLDGHGLDATIRRVLDFTGLGPEAARPAGNAVARPEAVARDRHGDRASSRLLLLLDEPTAGMSPEETERDRRDAARRSTATASPSSRSSTT